MEHICHLLFAIHILLYYNPRTQNLQKHYGLNVGTLKLLKYSSDERSRETHFAPRSFSEARFGNRGYENTISSVSKH